MLLLLRTRREPVEPPAEQVPADRFPYAMHYRLGRYVGLPAIGRMAQRVTLNRRRR